MEVPLLPLPESHCLEIFSPYGRVSHRDCLSEIFEEKNIKPSVDTVFELSDINKALDKVDKGGSKGKTLIKIGE